MSQQRRLSLVLLLNVVMIGGLIVVGLAAHSLGLVAAGGDFVADSLAIILGLVAVHLRDRHGRAHAPTYVALANVTLLLGFTGFVLVEGLRRLITGSPEVHGLPILILSGISTLVMFAGALILGRGASSEDLHMRSVLLDTISDGLAAAAVAVAGAIILVSHGLYWLDAAAAIAIGVIIGLGALRLLRDVVTAASAARAQARRDRPARPRP
ncbi:MAG TPA: cation diffusion facilitator family transporter [Pedococcus sp.]|nr:cation diffusion facilitator family transporter [Pedococcus sp.]